MASQACHGMPCGGSRARSLLARAIVCKSGEEDSEEWHNEALADGCVGSEAEAFDEGTENEEESR